MTNNINHIMKKNKSKKKDFNKDNKFNKTFLASKKQNYQDFLKPKKLKDMSYPNKPEQFSLKVIKSTDGELSRTLSSELINCQMLKEKIS